MNRPVFSVVIPCYNEEAVLEATHARLTGVMQGLGESYELIYVNDGSRDGTRKILDGLCGADSSVRVIHFARNSGHQTAVSAGLDYASGDAVVIIDADLQDPPELIPEMAALWRGGAGVVYGKRRSRAGETAFKKWSAGLFYRFLRLMAGPAFPEDTGDFRLVDRKVADVVRAMPEHNRYLRGMFAWAGFRQEALLYDRDRRFAGETQYSLKKMLRLASDGIIAFSGKPLAFASLAGLFWTLAGLAGAAVLAVLALLGRAGGAAWLAALGCLLAGNILLALGILGAYLSRVYDEAKGRPLYVLDELRGFPEPPGQKASAGQKPAPPARGEHRS